MSYRIPYNEYLKLKRRALKAKLREVCGVIILKNKIMTFKFERNISEDNDCFHMMIPKSYRNNKNIIGSFHSHPKSDATLSKRDIKGAFYKGYALIYSVIDREFKLWYKNLKEIPVKVQRSPNGKFK